MNVVPGHFNDRAFSYTTPEMNDSVSTVADRRKCSAKDLASRILTRVFRNLSERQMLLSVFLSRVHRRYSLIKKRQET